MSLGAQVFVCRFLVCALSFVLGLLLHPSFAAGQESSHEQSYPYLKAQVEQTLRKLGAYSGGQLPILEGFVALTNDALDHYQRPFFQYSIQLLPSPSGKTLVRVTAKITAWYSGPDPSRSGYRELTSNGRLESDLLARLDDALKSFPPTVGSASVAPSTAVSPITLPTPKMDPVLPELRAETPVRKPGPSVSSNNELAAPTPPSNAAPTKSDIEALRKQTEALEKRREQLSSTAHELEEILRVRAHPMDLAVVRNSGAPVLAQPESTSRILLRAEAEDEFEILDVQTDWIHLQISGASRGWIRRSQTDLPEAFEASGSSAANRDLAATAAEPFRVTREQTLTFAGNWEPLKGKTVRLIWVEPALHEEKKTGPSAKLTFAKKVFLKAATELAQSQTSIAGVVVVFDSADGGQVAAPLSVLERWKSGTLSDTGFWKELSLDPPETFQNSPKS